MAKKKYHFSKADITQIVQAIPNYALLKPDGTPVMSSSTIRGHRALANGLNTYGEEDSKIKANKVYVTKEAPLMVNHFKRLTTIASTHGEEGIKAYILKCNVEYKAYLSWLANNPQN